MNKYVKRWYRWRFYRAHRKCPNTCVDKALAEATIR